jgi:hypothetical protein
MTGVVRTVSKSGLTSSATTVHITLTCVTCGLWSPVWLVHWLIAGRKTVTTRAVTN